MATFCSAFLTLRLFCLLNVKYVEAKSSSFFTFFHSKILAFQVLVALVALNINICHSTESTETSTHLLCFLIATFCSVSQYYIHYACESTNDSMGNVDLSQWVFLLSGILTLQVLMLLWWLFNVFRIYIYFWILFGSYRCSHGRIFHQASLSWL